MHSDLDTEFLGALISAGREGFRNLQSTGFKREFLKDPQAAKVYDYIQQFNTDFGELPQISLIQDTFGVSSVEVPSQNLKYYTSKLTERHVWAICGNLSNFVKQSLQDTGSPDALVYGIENAKKAVLDASRKLILETSAAKTFDITKNTISRRETYLERKKLEGITGIPTPWPKLTQITRGFQPGHTYQFTGPRGSGKSFLLCVMSMASFDGGYEPLIYTQEMKHDEYADRYDALKCGIDYSKLLDGCLEAEEETKYFQHLDWLETLERKFYINENAGSKGLEYLRAEAQIVQPRIIFIDNIYLFAKSLDYKDLKNLSMFLKNWAQEDDVPIVYCTQLNDSGKTAYAKGIEDEASGVFNVHKPEGFKHLRYIEDTKNRTNEDGSVFCINFDIHKGDISERPDYKFDDTENTVALPGYLQPSSRSN